MQPTSCGRTVLCCAGPSTTAILGEDPGSEVWAHPDLEPFLRDTYRRHAFAREIRLTESQGEKRQPHSVFAVKFERAAGLVTVRPLWDGEDAKETLAEHVRVLQKDGIANIFFRMDLGRAWQANLTPALLANGFSPNLVIPYGGKGDLAIFQHGRG